MGRGKKLVLFGEGINVTVRLIALDLDRTTLDGKGELSKENRVAIEECVRKGIHVVIASGRSLESLPICVLEIPGIRYIISSNGAAMYEKGNPVPQKQVLLNPQVVDRLLELMREEEVTFEAFIDGTPYADQSFWDDPVSFGATENAISYIRRTRKPVPDIRHFLEEHRCKQESVDIVVRSEMQRIRLMEVLWAELKDVYITSSVERLIEISSCECGKHNGLAFFLEKLGIDPEDVVAFGDAENDLEMLQMAGIGIAVANASERIKKAADYVTLSHDQDGVAYALREILHLF